MQLKENQAIARGMDLPISTKKSIDICKFVRGKEVVKARFVLTRVLDMKEAVPAKRHKQDIPHRPGPMAAGRYPQKASKMILGIINLAEKNALNKGLNTEGLIIKVIKADKASRPMHSGRQGRTMMKRTHIEVIVEEVVKGKINTKVKAKEVKPEAKKEAPKTEAKKVEEKPAEVKTEEKKEATKTEEKKAEEKPAEVKTEEKKPEVIVKKEEPKEETKQ